MPILGDLLRGKDSSTYIWTACEICGKERWVKYRISSGRPVDKYCSSCAHKLTYQDGRVNPLTGKTHSQETKDKISKSLKGRKINKDILWKWKKRKGEKNPLWKGGKFISQGYVYIRLYEDDPYFPMVKKSGHINYIQEHRLVMAKNLNRFLEPWEVVHHKNGIRNDNRIENLILLECKEEHLPSQAIQCHIKRLKIENELLKSQIKSLINTIPT